MQNKAGLTDGILEWMYEHSGAIPGSVTALVHDAQEIAILSGKEELGIATLNQAYERRMKMLHPYITPNIRINKKYAKAVEKTPETINNNEAANFDSIDIPALVEIAKKNGEDIVTVIGNYIPVRQVVL